MNKQDLIKLNPWMSQLELADTCGICDAQLGEQHFCGWARCSRCSGQYISCGCEEPLADTWSGVFCPELHKVCLEQQLYCRSFIDDSPVSYKEAIESQSAGKKVRWFVACSKEDEFADFDLNRAVKYLYST